MVSLFGIIIFHILILVRTQVTRGKTVPYGSVFILTLLLTVFVLVVLMTMEEPEQLG